MIAGPFDNLDPQRVSLCYVVAGLMPTTCGMIGLQKYGRRWRGKTISISCRRFVLAVIQQLRIAWTPFKLTGRAEQRLEREQEPLRYPLRSYEAWLHHTQGDSNGIVSNAQQGVLSRRSSHVVCDCCVN